MMNETLPELWLAYTRKSRHKDPENITDAELFQYHREALAGLWGRLGAPGEFGEHYFQEVGSSETVEGRRVFREVLTKIRAFPYPCRVHLLCMDQDRVAKLAPQQMMEILTELQARGTILHQAEGGAIDLTDDDQFALACFKGILDRMGIQKYKKKKQGVCAQKLKNAEIRQGQVVFGLWWDKTEPRVADRCKKDERERDARPSELGFGLTNWEKMVAICRAVRHTSIRRLAVQYNVPADTLYGSLESPACAGYPVLRTRPVLETHPVTGQLQPKRNSAGQVMRQKVPRAEWVFPENPGDFPHPVDTLDEWLEIEATVGERKHGKIKSHCGIGVSKDRVRIEGAGGPVLLSRRMTSVAKDGTVIRVPTYRQLATPDVNDQKGAREIERALVDAAAAAAIRELVAEPAFFAWAITSYYERRQEIEPDDADRRMEGLNQQLAKLKGDLERAEKFLYQAQSEAQAAVYDRHILAFTTQMAETQKEKAALRAARSPIRDVDAAMPFLVALTREFDPAFWAEHWETIWGRLTPMEQRLLVNMCVKEIPVLYEPQARGADGRIPRAKRVVLPVVYADFFAAARQEWTFQPTRAHEISSPRSVKGVWEQIAALVPQGCNRNRAALAA